MRIFTIKLNRLIIPAILIFAAALVTAFAAAKKEGIPLPIAMYHSVLADNSKKSSYIITPEQFESDVDALLNEGYTPITVKALTDYVYNDLPLPEKPVMLTFDDGFYNNYSYIYPIIKEKNIPIVISVVGSYTDLYTKSGETNPLYSCLRRSDIAELNNSGLVEFQNHSYDLHTIDSTKTASMKLKGESDESYRNRLTADLTRTQELLFSITGKYPSAYTYPFGKISDSSVQIIKDMGFLASLSCEEGMNFITKSPDCLFRLKRLNRSGEYSTAQFIQKLLCR